MKTALKTITLAALLTASAHVYAQDAPPDELAEAGKALASGSEIRAWKLFSQNEAAFNQRMAELEPSFVVWVADQFRRQKRYGDAKAISDKIVSDSETYGSDVTAQAMLVKGDVLRDQGNYAGARLEYQSLERNEDLRKTPAGKMSRFRMVEIHRLTKNYEAAEEILERLRDSRDLKTQAEAHYQFAMLAFDREDYEGARELVAEARQLDAAHVEALFLEARLNLIEDRLQDPELEIGTRVLSSYVIPGRPVTLKMQDRNLAVVRGGTGIPVELETSGGDAEKVTLLPSPRDATLFRAVVHSLLGPPDKQSSRLEVNGNDVVTYRIDAAFQRDNDLKYDEKQMIVASDAELTASSGEFLSEEEMDQRLLEQRIAMATQDEETMAAYERVRDTSVIRPGNEIHVQVVDADRDMGEEQDQLFVECQASSGDSISGVPLTETEAHSGTFRGAIPTARAAPRPTATGTVEGADPFAPLTSKDTGAWSGEGEEVAYAVDLMAAHPLDHANLTVDAQSGLERVKLLTATGEEEEVEELASTHPTDRAIYGYIDLAEHFTEEDPEKTAAYLYTELKSDVAGPAVLKIGSCDGIACWLNGERVHNNQGGRLWKPEEDVVNVNLKAGINAILLRVSQLTGPWGASVTLLSPDGKPLPTVESPPPLMPGVLSEWHLFDRLTPENIKVAQRLNVHRPIRVAGEFFYWIPMNVCPPASLKQEGDVLTAIFNRPLGVRHLQWVFEAFKGPRVTVKSVDVKNHFDEQVLPVDVDYSAAAANRTLELGPGDTVSITYTDERRISTEEVLEADLTARFHDAEIMFAYDVIETARDGTREVTYDQALRYRAGETKRLAVFLIDYDADISADPDKAKVLIENTEGEKIWMDALETEPHSGEFVAILRLGDATEGETIRVGPEMHLTVSYKDRENSDGVLARTSEVLEAADEPPELIGFRSIVTYPEPTEGQMLADVEPEIDEQPAEGGTAEEPVVTSMAVPVTFRAIYPNAALREGSTIKANVSVIPAAGAEEAAEERACEVMMKVSDGKLAEFSAEIEIGSSLEDAPRTDLFAPRRAGEEEEERYILDARGGELLKITLASLDGATTHELHYRLATDAKLRFMDRKYLEEVEHLHAGDYLYLSVTDEDMDTTVALDSITVQVESGDVSREVTLAETLPRSGRFSGRIKTESADIAGENALPVTFGGSIKATYRDATCVVKAEGRDVVSSLGLFQGADGTIAGFSKRFSEEDIAVRTRLLTAEALFEMAKDYRKTDQEELADEVLAEGRMILEEAIADYPHTEHAPHAEYLLGDLAQELERFGEALARYNKVLSAWPDSEFAPRAQLRKGVCLEKMEDYDNAMDAYVELTYLYPKSELVSDAVVRLGQHFYRNEAFGVAGRIFGRFEAQHPEHPLAPKTLFLSAQSFVRGADQQRDETGRYTTDGQEMLLEAADAFDKLVDSYDNKDLRAEALYWLGDCRMKQTDYKQAYMAFKGLTIEYPETKWAKFARGQLVQNEQAFADIAE